MSSMFSSNIMKTPGSFICIAPQTRNSAANMVLPQPGPPHTRVGRPRGTPPPVISSNPRMPVAALGKVRSRMFCLAIVEKGRAGGVADVRRGSIAPPRAGRQTTEKR